MCTESWNTKTIYNWGGAAREYFSMKYRWTLFIIVSCTRCDLLMNSDCICFLCYTLIFLSCHHVICVFFLLGVVSHDAIYFIYPTYNLSSHEPFIESRFGFRRIRPAAETLWPSTLLSDATLFPVASHLFSIHTLKCLHLICVVINRLWWRFLLTSSILYFSFYFVTK